MITNDRLELAHWVVKAAKAEGASDIAVDIANSRSVEIEFRDSGSRLNRIIKDRVMHK